MIRLFEEQVQKNGEKTAICDPVSGQSVTYSELDESARRISAKLISDGFAHGDIALITASRSIGFIEAMFGVLMAGGAYVPLSDHYPEDRLSYIKDDCGAKLVLDDAAIAVALEYEPIDASVETAPEDMALIIYTSGSTGNPKGVIHDHKALREQLLRYGSIIDFKEDDVYGIGGAFYFVLSLGDIYTGLITGITEVIVPEHLKGDPVGLSDFIAKQKITVTVIMPKVLRYFTKKGDSLRTVMTCGERVSQLAPDGYRLLNCYGMTELTGEALAFYVDKAYDNTPIGKPQGDVRVYLLDENGSDGDEGEICVAGHMGRGYLNLPEETAKTFVPNPFKEKDGHDILIRTGDLGRRLPDGNILYLNRRDWMVKINGQRVEPGEIEVAIRALSGISDAVVRDFVDAAGQTFLAAYYLSDEEKDENELKEALLQKLPEYMVPAFFVHMDKLPVNANGKLDRAALPKPGIDLRHTAYAAPENEKQRLIIQAFEEVLGLSDIGIDDEFFALGGDSIKVLMLQKALRERDIEISANAVFKAPTPRLLSETIQETSAYASYQGTAADAYPLTKAQMSIYLDCQTEGKETAYNNTFSLFLPSDMAADEKHLKEAVEMVLNAYPILASTVKVVDGIPSLVPSGKAITAEIRETDILSRNDLSKSVAGAFDIEKEPLTRAVIFRTQEGLLLVLVMHHIVCDGTTASILIKNIAAAYNGTPLASEEMSNFTLAQYEASHPEITEKDNAVYRKMLDGVEGDTALYSDGAPELSDFKGKLRIYDTTLFTEKEELSGRLRSFLSDHQLTESTLFMSAYAYMLRLFCNQKEVLFFAGENGRHDPVLQNTVGMLVHNLPVFTRIEETAAGVNYMAGMQKTFHELVAADGADIAGLLGEYGIHPECFFVYQGDMLSGATIDGRFIPMEIHVSEDVMATLTLHVLKQPGGDYALKFEYAAEKLSEETIKRMADVFCLIVAGLCEDARLCDIRLVTDENIAEMDIFNKTERDYPVTDIVSMFRQTALQYPDRPAVIYKDETLTYTQVDAISERIADKIRSLGIGRGDVVSILIPRCTYMTTASLGVLKIGAAYQPLDPSYPTDRLTFMMSDADAKLLIADEELLSKVPEYKGEVLLTKDIPALPDCGSTKEDIEPDDLFILLYTSGSTGTPKGVMLEHRNLANFCYWYRDFYGLDENSRVAAYASYGFDADMMDQYPALTTGACVVIIEEEIRLDLAALEDCFNRNGVTHSFMTTQVGRQFYTMTDTKSLKFLSVGGEKLVPLPTKAGEPLLYNVYGPTECTIFSTTQRMERLYERVPIGKPLANYRLYVADENLRRLPPLVPGEMLISGRGVGRGYLNRPDLTEKAFIRNPFDPEEDYARAYRSGDVVRLLPDGSIDFIGRNDGQVKVRGFRIELTEVEGVIREFPGITDATVQAFEDKASGEKFIAAYVVSGDPVDVSAMNAFIQERKPPYMVPAVTMQIDAIPLNQNQKVNKRALPEPMMQAEDEDAGEDRPLTYFEGEIAKVLSETLRDTEIRPYVSLVRYGLTSISAIGVMAKLFDRFHVQIPASELLDGMTVADIGDAIFREWDRQRLSGTEEPQTTESEKQSSYPLSSVQLGIYYDAMKREADTVYNIPMCFAFDHIDAKCLADAVAAAIRAHAYLNTHIEFSEGELVQVRCDDLMPTVPVMELSGEEFEAYKDAFVRPFDLSSSPLYRFEIVKTTDKVYLFMDIHHIIFDGFSVQVLLNDISTAYLGGEPQSEKYTYFDYALEDKAYQGSEKYRQAEAYFDEMLTSFDSATKLSPDRKGNSENGRPADECSRIAKDAVDAYCRENAVTQSAVFLAGVFYALSRFAAAKDVLVSTISAGRDDVRRHSLTGMFVHTIPLAMHFNSGITAKEAIASSADVLRRSVANEDYPFALLAAKYDYSTSIMYECQLGIMEEGGTIGGERYETLPLTLETPKFDISMIVTEKDDSYEICVHYNDALYSGDYMKCLAECTVTAIKGMIKTPGQRVSTLSLLPEKDKEHIVALGRGVSGEVPIPILHKMFEKAAGDYADKTALIACDKTLTFQELDEEANIIANGLLTRGTKKGGSVVLLLPRKSFYFAALFGILKAGAAFIPCDPAYPSDRIGHIITDSGADFIITTSDKLSDFPADKALDVEELLNGTETAAPDVEVSPEAIAYMIYTSGSTGKPKGVMLRHVGICNYLMPDPANLHMYELSKHTSCYLSVTTVSFDMSFKEHTAALCNGKTLVFANEQEMNDPRALSALMEKYDVDCFNATPSRLAQYMEYAPFREQLAKCALVMSGGEGYPMSLRDAIRKCSGEIRIMNTYGPTEITVSSNAADLTEAEAVTVGRPLANYTEYIVDSDLNLLPVGVTGELLIGGPGVAVGYVNLPEKTAEAFITFNGERVYRTGDYARWDKDGNVVILGRIDGQVKLRGLRIEPDEIVGLMEQQLGIKRAIVVVKELNGQDNLCAYFTADTEIELSALHDALAAKLTHYMVPSSFTQLADIPTTPNGKVNFRALPEPVLFQTGAYEAPADDIETYFCGLFAKVLSLDTVGVNDDFFNIGGTSLSATSVMIGATEDGYRLSYGDIFKYKTPRLLAALFKDKNASGDGTQRLTVFDDYDYTKIDAVLSGNTTEAFSKGELREIGNILLTGATGFMGIHVLAEYLRSESGTAWCLVRKGRYADPMIRLNNMLHYYFGDEFEGMDDRIRTINGDVTDYAVFESLEMKPIDTVFNCAASVKHFSSGTDIEDINVGGAVNCVRFCEKTKTRLIHFSTTSVNGAMLVSSQSEIKALDEGSLYFGQILNNQYVISKLLAERTVIGAVAEKGIDAKVIRVGTLAARESDGEFQINYLSNSFMERLRSYVLLGSFPYSFINMPMRLGPIDVSARAFMVLAKTPSACCLFNAVNVHSVPTVDVIRVMQDIGLNIELTDDKTFEKMLADAGNDPKKAAILSSLLAYQRNTNLVEVPVRFEYTAQILARMGFFWNITDAAYIHRFIEGMAGLGFFDENNFVR